MLKLSRRYSVVLLALFSLHCSHGPQTTSDSENETPPHLGPEIETIAILGTNDIHGALAPLELKTREPEGTSPIPYRAGGMATISSYVKVLRGEFGPSLLWLDAGDEFQGTIDSNLQQGAPMVKVLNAEGTNAAAVGNHEFDFGPSQATGADVQDRLGALKTRISEARYPYLGANILNATTGKLASDLLPGLVSRKILDTGRVKVGIIGLTTTETPKTTSSVNLHNLRFADLKDTTLREAAALRSEGAQVIVLVAHVGLKCEKGRASQASHVRKSSEPQGECGSNGELVKLLKSLPAGTVDGAVAGHSHQVVHHWVAGVPVIQGGASGRYLNVIYLNYDLKQGKLLPDFTRIEGPVPVCPLVFQNQNDCNGDRPAPKMGRGPLIAPRFHGEKISPDSKIAHLLEPDLEKSEGAKKVVVAIAARPIEHEREKESPLGNLITDALIASSGAQVAMMNPGGIRAPWEAGPITYDAVFRTLPFDNTLVKLKLTGRELKILLRIATSGGRGFSSFAGVRLRVIHPDSDAPSSDLNGDRKIEPWEVNRILEAKLADGKEIQDSQTYTLATLDFLVTGGDDMGWFMSQIPAARKIETQTLVRDAISQHLQQLAKSGPINTVESPIYDPSHPRLKLEKISAKTKGKGKGRHKKRKK